jgi:hypothetical protein
MRYLSLLISLLAACTAPLVWSREQPPFIEALLQGDDAIVVTAASDREAPVVTLGRRFGGSVVSIYYRGVEYVNNHNSRDRVDYGRQLQSAVQYRGVGECFNPTEAGGRYDKGRPASSSRLLSVDRPTPNVVVTQTDMAFWMAPGDQKSFKGKECKALNTDYRAGYLLKRTLQVGVQDHPNVISYRTQFIAPVVEPNPRYEVIVIHVPSGRQRGFQQSVSFKRLFRVNTDGTVEEIVGKDAQRGNLPFMLTTDDQLHAVVACSATQISVYGYRHGDNTIASRFVYFGKNPEKESHVFQNYVIVGSASEVQHAAGKFCFAR